MSLVKVRYTLPGPDQVPQWIDEDLLDWDAPYDLAAAPIGGARAVDSRLVAHTGDRLPTDFAYTASGNLYAISPEKLDVDYFKIKARLHYADEIWRGPKHLKLSYALLTATTPLAGQCVVPASIVCAVKELRWYDAHGRPLE